MNKAGFLDQEQIDAISSIAAKQNDSSATEQKRRKIKERGIEGKRRVIGIVSDDDYRAIKVMMAELGLDESGGSSSERMGRFLSLAIKVLNAEMEMARVSTNMRYISESTFRDYIQRKLDDECRNVRLAPLFDE